MSGAGTPSWQRFVWQTSQNAFDTFPIHTQLPTWPFSHRRTLESRPGARGQYFFGRALQIPKLIFFSLFFQPTLTVSFHFVFELYWPGQQRSMTWPVPMPMLESLLQIFDQRPDPGQSWSVLASPGQSGPVQLFI